MWRHGVMGWLFWLAVSIGGAWPPGVTDPPNPTTGPTFPNPPPNPPGPPPPQPPPGPHLEFYMVE